MKTMHKIKTAILLAAAASLILAGCHKEKMSELTPGANAAPQMNQRIPGPTGNASFTLKLVNTSPRANYGAVNVEIIGAVIHYSDKKLGISGYSTLTMKSAIYNLMDLINAPITLATGTSLPAATVDQVRLIFGIHNTVIIGSNLSRSEYPLHVHDPISNFANVPTHTLLVDNQNVIVLLDFNALQSVDAEQEMEGRAVVKTNFGLSSNGIRNIFFLEPQIRELSPVAQ